VVRRDVGGTPAYMAPEQATGGEVDGRADLYSLCLVAYRALTGRPAYLAQRPSELVGASDEVHAPPDPTRWVELPHDLVLALRIGLAPDPEDRFASALEMVVAFDHAFDGRLAPAYREHGEQLLRRCPWAEGTAH
jgi:serine/threonine-protein kinase